MELRPLSPHDLPLYLGMYTNPTVMAELGGVQTAEVIARRLERALGVVRAGTGVVLTVWDDDSTGTPAPAGIVCYWLGEIDRLPAHEIGWMLLPEFQGRGLASEATRQLIETARADSQVKSLFAMTSVGNAPSNAICRKLGFVHVDDRPMEYDGQMWPGRLWRMDF